MNKTFKDIYTDELAKGAILNELMEGFKEDYLILHCLLRLYNPRTVMEIGTHIGTGTKIICNAVPGAKVYSLDLQDNDSSLSKQHPLNSGYEYDKVGHTCDLPYTQLFGDSLNFDYSNYPCEAWFIDGEHDYDHPKHEAQSAINTGAKLIIFHDADMPEVARAINDVFYNTDYTVYRVTDTRIAYALKN